MRQLNEAQLKIIRPHHLTAPINMVPIANDFGIDVLQDNNFPDNLSGLIRLEDDGRYHSYICLLYTSDAADE